MKFTEHHWKPLYLSSLFVRVFHLCPEMHAMAKMAKMANELDAKRGPLETGDFGEISNFGKIGGFGENRQGVSDIQNVANIQIGCQKWPLQIR